jgi:aminopeptidase
MKQMQHYIAIVGEENDCEMSDVPSDKMRIVHEHWSKPVSDYQEKNMNWVVVRWPTPAMAQRAEMSTEAFEDFYFNVCTLDYAKMDQAGMPLRDRMMSADMIHIKGARDTDLSFSVQGIPAMISAGDRNIPDGEVFTAPVKNSINGVLHYNAGTIYHGKPFDNIRLVFKDGKIVEATGSDTKSLNEILDTDEGSRYVGEFSLGFNPYIKKVMRDVLFDEKIDGSIHFTPGQAYEEADNGNRSKIHWDMVLIQTEEYGGGEIWFDDRLIRKDGVFVIPELEVLNPERLI